MNVWETSAKKGENNNLVSAVNFVDWRGRCQSFEQAAGWRFLYLNLTGRDEPERVQGLTVSPSYFPLLGVEAALGRTFLPEEEEPGRDKVVILSHALWRRRFGSDPGVVGRQITVEGEPRTVVGVLPADFHIFRVLNRELDVYIPLTLDRSRLGRHGTAGASGGEVMFVYARLKPGASVEQAQAEMDAIYRGLDEGHPQNSPRPGVRLVPLPEQWGERARPALLMLFAAVGFVLVIACADVTNLLLARATARRKEMHVRAALGASRSRLARQALTESLLLALPGGLAGLLLAFWGVGLLNRLLPYTALNRADDFRLDPLVLAFTLAVTLLTGLACGLAPALRSSKLDLTGSLKEGGGGVTAGAREGRLRDLLVVSQITLAMVLLVGAGLMLRSISRLHTIDRGLKTDLGIFAGLALLLAVAGIYGVMAYSVAERTREIGLRMALGASAGDVLRMVVRRGMLSVLAGVAAGLAATLMLTRALSSALYGVSAVDPVTYAAVSALLSGSAFAACYMPARKATKVDPKVALRHE